MGWELDYMGVERRRRESALGRMRNEQMHFSLCKQKMEYEIVMWLEFRRVI